MLYFQLFVAVDGSETSTRLHYDGPCTDSDGREMILTAEYRAPDWDTALQMRNDILGTNEFNPFAPKR